MRCWRRTGGRQGQSKGELRIFSCCFIFFLLLSVGCATTRPLPAINLNDAGWILRKGQAVWQPKDLAPELVGDALVASHPDGRSFVQFSKGLPILSGQRNRQMWQVEIPAENRRHSGSGKPPKRLIWLHLPEIYEGAPPPKGWSVILQTSEELELYQEDRGERLRLLLQ